MIEIVPREKYLSMSLLVWSKSLKKYLPDGERHFGIKNMEENKIYFCYSNICFVLKENNIVISFKIKNTDEPINVHQEIHKLFLQTGSYKKVIDFLAF